VPLTELKGLSPELLAILNGAGYQTLNDVLDLERDEVAQLPGMTQERADQLMALLAELTDEDSDDGRGGS
jgi:N utilization substance protein A